MNYRFSDNFQLKFYDHSNRMVQKLRYQIDCKQPQAYHIYYLYLIYNKINEKKKLNITQKI